jgi:thioredoxin 1
VIEAITEATFRQEIQETDVPMVVDFHADWCEPCHQLAPVLEQLAQKWEPRVRFAKVNVDHAPELADSYQIHSIPAVLLFDRGQPVARSIGVKPASKLESDLGLANMERD